MYSCFTESLFHTSYLSDRLKSHDLIWLVRNSRQLDRDELDEIHKNLSKKEALNKKDLKIIEKAYGGLSEAEAYLALTYGVPETHPLKLAEFVTLGSFSDEFFSYCTGHENALENLGAVIFLDVILQKKWIDFFEGRIVNAHSAILPYARGMFAIEQFIVDKNRSQVEQAAGATIHYIDTGIDTGEVIETSKLDNIWDLESIWAVKGESYLLAFELMNSYLFRQNKFTFSDTTDVDKNSLSPLYISRNFTENIKRLSEKKFRSLKGS